MRHTRLFHTLLFAAATCLLPAVALCQQISSISFSPASVSSTQSATGTVKISKAAASGFLIKLSSSASAASVPGSVSVNAGQTSATFTVSTGTVKAAEKVTITGTDPAKKTAKGTLTVNPPAHLTKVSFSPSAVPAGQTATGTVTLSGAAPANGLVVKLGSKQSFATVPPSVTVPSGSSSATFTVGTGFVTSKETASISGTDANGFTESGSLSVELAAVRVTAVTFATSSVTAANPAKGTVTLSQAAPSSGFTVNLSSKQSFVSAPGSVKVLSGAKTATFTVLTKPLNSAGAATVTATDQVGYTASGKLTVLIPALRLASLTISPNAVFSSGSATGTVTLSGKAPKAGFTVTISTMATTAVTIPMTVNVASGETSATFTITAGTVTSTVAAAINAADANMYVATANLNVNPVVGIATTDSRTYLPVTYTAAAGSTITWTNISFMGHTVTSDTGVPGLTSGNINPGATFSWTIPANAPSGTMYFYHCDYHGFAGNGSSLGQGMAGVIMVK